MTDFALATLTEFCQSGSISNIDSAIFLYRQVIHRRKPSNHKLLVSMDSLAGALILRWIHSRQRGHLDEALAILQDCLGLPPALHPNHPHLRSKLCALSGHEVSLDRANRRHDRSGASASSTTRRIWYGTKRKTGIPGHHKLQVVRGRSSSSLGYIAFPRISRAPSCPTSPSVDRFDQPRVCTLHAI